MAPKRAAPGSFRLISPHTLECGRQRLAVGLLWQLRAADMALREQGRVASTALDAFGLCLLHANGRQVAFATSADGRRHGMRAAAPLFERAKTGETWLAAFALPAAFAGAGVAWWVVAHRDGLIYEDRVFTDEFEARAVFADEADAPGWEQVFCPEGWGVQGSSEVPLEAVMQPRARGPNLRPISNVELWLPRVLFLVVLAVLAAGTWYLAQWWLEIQREIEEQNRRAQEAARRAAAEAFPWQERPMLDDFVIGCVDQIDALNVAVPGWRSEPVTCTAQRGGAVARARWTAQGGRAVMLRATLDHAGLGPDAPRASAEEGSAARQFELPVVADPRAVLPLPPAAMASRLAQRFNTLGLDNIIMRERITRLTPEQARTQTQPVFNYHEMTLVTSAALGDYVRLLSDIPALVPESLEYDPNAHEWTLVARIYHPPLGGLR